MDGVPETDVGDTSFFDSVAMFCQATNGIVLLDRSLNSAASTFPVASFVICSKFGSALGGKGRNAPPLRPAICGVLGGHHETGQNGGDAPLLQRDSSLSSTTLSQRLQVTESDMDQVRFGIAIFCVLASLAASH